MSDAAGLSSFIDQVSGGSRLRVETDLGDGFVRLRVSEAERRQAIQDIRCVEDAVVEMLRNARDAHARTIVVGSSRSGDVRRIVMVDDGDGVPERLREAVFEPRVTSKLDSMTMDDWGVHGRGMALYSIRENAEDARISASVEGQGSAFSVRFDARKVTERSDQSTAPSIAKGDDGAWSIVGGPHNIVRAVAEFALANRASCTVYLGSLVDAAATLHAFGRQFLRGAGDFPRDADEAAPMKRLALASDAADFALIAEGLGIELSSRSAHRIIQGKIAPLSPLLETLRRESPDASVRLRNAKKADLARDFRGLKIAADDLDDFRESIRRAFAELADRYYLEPDVDPSIRVASDGLHVTFPVRKL